MRPVRMWLSECHEIMQVNLSRGEWVQVCLALHKLGEEPRYEIVQLSVSEDGVPELRGNLPIVSWGPHDAEPIGEDERRTRPVVEDSAS